MQLPLILLLRIVFLGGLIFVAIDTYNSIFYVEELALLDLLKIVIFPAAVLVLLSAEPVPLRRGVILFSSLLAGASGILLVIASAYESLTNDVAGAILSSAHYLHLMVSIALVGYFVIRYSVVERSSKQE